MRFKGFNYTSITQIEDSLGRWIVVRRYRILFYLFLVTIIIAFSSAPYINLFFDYYFIIFASLVIAPFVLDIDAKIFVIMALILLIFASLVWFYDKEHAENLGNYIFIVLFSGMLKTFFSTRE